MTAATQLAHDLWGRSELPVALGNMAAAIDENATGANNLFNTLRPAALRSPLPTDDVSLYNVGDLWLAPPGSPKRLYQLANNTAGLALWTPLLTAAALPMDILAPAAGYGPVKLRQAYAGNCIRVINSSVVTLDIPFAVQNGISQLDVATLDAHLAGLPGTVDILYDHGTGALDATQTVAANRPIIAVDTIGGVRVVVLDSITKGSTPALVSKWFDLPVGLSIVPRTATIVAAGQNYFGGQGSMWATLGATTDFNAWCIADAVNGAPQYPMALSINGSLGLPAGGGPANVPSRADPAVNVWNCDTNVASYYANNHAQTGVTTNRGAVAVTGGSIGGTTVANAGNFMLGAMLFYASAPTTAQLDAIRGSLSVLFNIAPQTMDTVVNFGESITAGQAGVLGRNSINQSIPMLSIPAREYNMAGSGNVLGPASANQAALAKIIPVMNRLYKPAIRNFIVFLYALTNDINTGRTIGQMMDDLATFFVIAKRFGSNVKTVTCTLIPNGAIGLTGTTGDKTRLALNAAIRTNWPSFADALCDYAMNPIMGDGVTLTDTALFSDQTHPTALGYSYLAIQRAAVINSLFAPFGVTA
jgi:hypothetical protein